MQLPKGLVLREVSVRLRADQLYSYDLLILVALLGRHINITNGVTQASLLSRPYRVLHFVRNNRMTAMATGRKEEAHTSRRILEDDGGAYFKRKSHAEGI
jgi:hypothetical protein